MALTVDNNTGPGATNVSSGNALSFTFTVGAGATQLLLYLWFGSSTTPASLSVHWDSTGTNQAMSAVPSAVANNSGVTETVILYGLVSPTSGTSKTLSVTWTGTAIEAHGGCISFTGGDTTSVAVAFPNGNAVVHTTAF